MSASFGVRLSMLMLVLLMPSMVAVQAGCAFLLKFQAFNNNSTNAVPNSSKESKYSDNDRNDTGCCIASKEKQDRNVVMHSVCILSPAFPSAKNTLGQFARIISLVIVLVKKIIQQKDQPR